MSWSIDNATAPASPFSGQQNPISHTVGSTAKLLIAFLFINGTTARTGGTPTYAGENMTDSGFGFKYYSGGECGIEIWYKIDPSTGSNQLSVPNTNSVSMGISIVSYIPSLGGCAFDNSNSSSGTTANPSLSLTVNATGNLIVAGLGSGYRNVPVAGTNFTLNHTSDEGNQTWGSEYDLAGSASPVTVAFVQDADDWGLIGVSFKEVAGNVNVNRSDGITTGESKTVDVSDPQKSVSDSVTLGEISNVMLLLDINVTDDTSIGESIVSWVSDPQITESDGITTDESLTITVSDLNISSSDGATVGESANISMAAVEDLDISESDGVNLGESVTGNVVSTQFSKSDAVSVGESATVTVSDLEITETDGATVGELIDVALGAAGEIDIGESDAVTLGESPSVTVSGLEIKTSDAVTLGESQTVSIPSVGQEIDVSDAVTVSDAPKYYTEDVIVGELVSVEISAPGVISISTSDDIVLGESSNVTISDLEISSSDGVTLGESQTVSVSEVGAIDIFASDTVTLGETASLTVSDLFISTTDAVTVAESVSVSVYTSFVGISVTDALSVGESVAIATGDLIFSVSDDLTLGDSATVEVGEPFVWIPAPYKTRLPHMIGGQKGVVYKKSRRW